MDGKQSRELTQILNAIEEGGFGKDELVQRLNALVDRELSQTDRPADMELTQACQDILYRLHHQGAVYMSNRTASLAKTRKKLRKPRFSLPSVSPVTRVAAILIILLGGSILFDVYISGDRLIGRYTPDEQQYIVEGIDINSIMTAEGDAHETVTPSSISTSSLSEALSVLDQAIAIPTWLPTGWEPHEYNAIVTSDLSLFRAKYKKTGEDEYIKYTVNIYPDADIARASIEQDMNGDTHMIGDQQVYITTNLGSVIALWLSDHTFYTVSGPISDHEIQQIVTSILGS